MVDPPNTTRNGRCGSKASDTPNGPTLALPNVARRTRGKTERVVLAAWTESISGERLLLGTPLRTGTLKTSLQRKRVWHGVDALHASFGGVGGSSLRRRSGLPTILQWICGACSLPDAQPSSGAGSLDSRDVCLDLETHRCYHAIGP